MKNILCLVLITICFLSGSLSANDKVDSSVIFTQMKSLVGRWVKEDSKNSKFSILFELTANDTTLIETWLYNGKKHSLTLYHQNGESLMATHYCPQGNQPRLQLSKNSSPSNVFFTYLDATNLKNLESSHQHSLSFDLSGSSNKVYRKESYLSKSGEETSEIVLVRQ